MSQQVSDGRKDGRPWPFLSQGYLNIVRSALLLQPTVCSIEQNNNKINGRTYVDLVRIYFILLWGHKAEEKHNHACYFSQKHNGSEGTKQTVG